MLKIGMGARVAYSLIGCMMLLLSHPAPARSQESKNYRGWKYCAACHSDRSDSWRKTKHANAFEVLKKSGQEGLPACVKCHVTGYEQPGGFIDNELTPELTDVQCEECHGPGSKHVNGQGLVMTPGIEICRRCHTQGQDPGFNYKEKVNAVHSQR